MKKIEEILVSTDISQDAVPEYPKKKIKIDLNKKNYIIHKYNQKRNDK